MLSSDPPPTAHAIPAVRPLSKAVTPSTMHKSSTVDGANEG